MRLPGFNAESALGPGRGGYRGRNVFGGSGAAEVARGVVVPAKPRQEWCSAKYGAYISHYFPVTLCRPINVELAGAVFTMAKPGGLGGPAGAFPTRALTSLKSRASGTTMFGRLQDCRVYALPFIADVTTTQACDDNIPDSSTMEVYGHPELTLHWTGGIDDIPAPYNPGWFTFLGQTCGCCGGFIQCPDGGCVPFGVKCEHHQA